MWIKFIGESRTFFTGVILLLLACSKPGIEEKDPVMNGIFYEQSSPELELLEKLNSYRSQKGLPLLLLQEEISVQAKNHNEHMISKNEVCHHFFGARYKALKKRSGAVAASENVAFGYHTAGAVVSAWAKSKGHRKNMEGNYSFVGISIRENKKGKSYYTSIFMRK